MSFAKLDLWDVNAFKKFINYILVISVIKQVILTVLAKKPISPFSQ